MILSSGWSLIFHKGVTKQWEFVKWTPTSWCPDVSAYPQRDQQDTEDEALHEQEPDDGTYSPPFA